MLSYRGLLVSNHLQRQGMQPSHPIESIYLLQVP